MDERAAFEQFIRKWLHNPELAAWQPKIDFDAQPQGLREEFYEKAHSRLRALMWETFTDPTIGAQVRDDMCWLVAVGMWEKRRRQNATDERTKGESHEEWALRAKRRVNDRMAGRVRDMPLTSKDGQVYLNLIEASVRRTHQKN